MNIAIFLGNMTADPELKYTPNGTAVCRFTVAINKRWKTASGETKEEVSFIQVKAFKGQAEACAEYTHKGSLVLVQGELKQERWEKDGQKHEKVGVVAFHVKFLDGKPAAAPGATKPATPPAAATSPAAAAPASEDDIPF